MSTGPDHRDGAVLEQVPMTCSRVLRAQHATILAAGLRDRGFAVCDLGLPSSTLSGLREEALGLHTSRDEPEFFSAVGKNQHRGDLIGWLGARGAAARKLRHLPLALDILLSELPAVLRDDGIAAPSRRVLPPAAAMLSLYQDGAAYAAPRRRAREPPRRARVRGRGRASALDARRRGRARRGGEPRLAGRAARYTAILYLNAEDWCARRDGGALRLRRLRRGRRRGRQRDRRRGRRAGRRRLVVFDSRAIPTRCARGAGRLAMTGGC